MSAPRYRRLAPRLAARTIAIAIATWAGAEGCAKSVFHCTENEACDDDGGDAGVCIAPGYCAFQDEDCTTGLVYGTLAPPDLAGECVPVSGGSDTGVATDTSGDGATPDGMSETGSGSTGAQGSGAASQSGGDPCPLGTPCDSSDPCAIEASCTADGACVPTMHVECDDPPGPCFEPVGTCGATGECEYTPRPAGEPCEDGDACTEGDACDDAGACVPGELCPTDNPCETRTCVQFACVSTLHDDGTSCGAEASARCCSGNCVDISSDTSHCGGCNTACAPGLDCESISETNTCDIAPEATSGRCRCQFSNAQCPGGQICRTYTPYTDRCVPPSEDNCAGTAVYQNGCPSFCTY